MATLIVALRVAPTLPQAWLAPAWWARHVGTLYVTLTCPTSKPPRFSCPARPRRSLGPRTAQIVRIRNVRATTLVAVLELRRMGARIRPLYRRLHWGLAQDGVASGRGGGVVEAGVKVAGRPQDLDQNRARNSGDGLDRLDRTTRCITRTRDDSTTIRTMSYDFWGVFGRVWTRTWTLDFR